MSIINRAFLRTWEVFHTLYYRAPNPIKPQVTLSQKAQKWLETLRRDGIVKIEDKDFRDVADYLDRTYFPKLEVRTGDHSIKGEELNNPELFARDKSDLEAREWGLEFTTEISFKDPNLAPLFLNSDINGLYYNYYRRQAYYRNLPILQKLAYNGKDAKHSGSFHVDNLLQVSAMLLISDTTDTDSHMNFALGSHKRPTLSQGLYLKHAKAEALSKNYEIYHCTGAKGTLFVFDTTGIHRRHLIVGNPRKMLHLNITPGHNIRPISENVRALLTHANLPLHSSEMFRKIATKN